MFKNKLIKKLTLCAIVLLAIFGAQSVFAQTTAFTYQGKLNNGGVPANGNYDMQFKLFDALAGGAQVGDTVTDSSVAVVNGVFTTTLDFGAEVFDGADRWLGIGIRPAGNTGAYTNLAPRQKLTSTPYSIKSKSAETALTANNATQFGGFDLTQFVQYDAKGNVGIGTKTTDSKLTVGGTIEMTEGEIKFPDATTQATAGLTVVTTDPTLTGDGTPAAPLGITSPLLIRDIDNPAFQPFQIHTTQDGVLLTIPVGKRLVLEFASGYLVIPSPIQSSGTIQINNTGTENHILVPLSVRPSGSSNMYLISQPIRMYFSAGQQLRIFFSGSAVTQYLSLTGYYVDVPEEPKSISNQKKK
jgi:hypothetical protein